MPSQHPVNHERIGNNIRDTRIVKEHVPLGALWDPLWIREIVRNAQLNDPASGTQQLDFFDLFWKFGVVPIAFPNRVDKPLWTYPLFNAGSSSHSLSPQQIWQESGAGVASVTHNIIANTKNSYVKTVQASCTTNDVAIQVSINIDSVQKSAFNLATLKTSDANYRGAQPNVYYYFDPPIKCTSSFQLNAGSANMSAIVTGWDE